MAEGLSTAAANALLDSLGGTYRWIQRHTGPPGPNGTANVSVDSARKQTTWAAAANAALASSADLLWTAETTAEDHAYFTAWTAQNAGTFGFSGAITANAVGVGDDFKVAAGGLTASFAVAS
ncbi:MAG TPA: hypothetical protein VGN37_24380 [Actinocatenispora sp.]